MGLTKKQEELYRQTMEEAKAQLDTIDEEMEKEIQKARERLEKLKESKESFRQLYEGAARLLGVKIEAEEESGPEKEPPSVESEENEEENDEENEEEESDQSKQDSSDESGS